MSFNWGDTFKSEPPGSQSPALGDDRIRETRGAVEERIENEHYTINDGQSNGSAAQDWWHKEGSAKIFYESSAPTVRNVDSSTPLTDDDIGRLWVKTDDTPDTLHVYTGTDDSWVEIVGATTVVQLVGTQTIAGAKTFSDAGVFSSTLTIGSSLTVSGDITITEEAVDLNLKTGDQAALEIDDAGTTMLSFDTQDNEVHFYGGYGSTGLTVDEDGNLTTDGMITAAGLTSEGNNIPEENNTADLGSTTKGWKDLHFSGKIVPPDDAVGSGWGGHLIPVLNDVYDLGTGSKEWNDLYVCGTGHIAHLQITDFGADWNNVGRTVADLGSVSTVDINGGTVDGVTIGSGGGVTIGGVDINDSDINGGTLDGVDIGLETVVDIAKVTALEAGKISFDEGVIYLKTKVVEIGAWNIVGSATKEVDLGVPKTSWRSITTVIRDDEQADFEAVDSWKQAGTANHIELSSVQTAANWNSTGSSRGWVTLTYIP